ncbi:hypothetical protein [Virgibacillus kimchii]
MHIRTQNSLWFILSITLNALGNSFMVISNLGSAPWTSAGENLVFILPLTIGICIFILHSFALFLAYLMKEKVTPGVVIKSITLAFAFGILLDLFLYIHEMVFVPGDMISRFIYLMIGLNLIAIAICIYFQSSSIYLPSDFLLKAFGKRMKNYTMANILYTSIPISIGLMIILYRSKIVGIGPGTILFMLGIGFLIDLYSRWIIIPKAPDRSYV